MVLPTVLVVDDCEDNRELFATVLRGAGLVVSTACDGVEAVAAATRERPDVIVLDLAMPLMDGFDVLEALRRDGPPRSPHVIVVSALSDPASRARASELGADDFLAKPCNPHALVARVRAAFENGRTAAAG